MELIEKVMMHFKCCESKAKRIIEKYRKNNCLNELKKLVEE